MKSLLIILFSFAIINLSGCSSNFVDPYIMKETQSEGIVVIGYKQNSLGKTFYPAIGNWEKGIAEASKVCTRWGYSHAESLNKISKDTERDGDETTYMECKCVN